MVGLLDVNVLVALLVPKHQHHDAAIEWFAAEVHDAIGNAEALIRLFNGER